MRLVHDDIVIGTGAQAIRLRPSLRAGMQLHKEWGINRLAEGVHKGSPSIMAAIIAATTDDPVKARDRLDRMIAKEGIAALFTVQEKLECLLIACFGLASPKDGEAPPAEEQTGDGTMSFSGFFERAFEIGTGWLGWSPADTYAATVTEILIAWRGKVAMLEAMHGTADKAKEPEEGSTFSKASKPEDGDIPLEQVREGLGKLRAILGK